MVNIGSPPNNARQDSRSPRVLLILMPWAPPRFPGLGPALLRTILNRDGIACDICYGNLLFSKIVEGDAIAESELEKLPVSELAFTPFYFDLSTDEAAKRLHEHVLVSGPDKKVHTRERYQKIVALAGECIDQLYRLITWSQYDVVGFSVMMEQTVPSLALAKRIKEGFPSIRIVFGGPNCSYPMGDEILRRFEEVDYVIEGEADASISPFIRELRERPFGPFGVPGVRWRDEASGLRYSGPAEPFADLDNLPVPDYSPYFEQLSALQVRWFEPVLQFECARGCWWGEKHHCTFCSLEDDLMAFRSKSEERIIEELLTLSRLYGMTEFYCTDSILNHNFFKTLLPQVGKLREENDYDFTFFFEAKSNLKRSDVQTLRYAGVSYIQPGIETFSDHILQLMEKGSTGARQLQCLKLLAECNIDVYWNLIVGNPLETIADYEDMIEMIPFMHHLPPMHKEGLVRLQFLRHSPYFLNPTAYGITSVRPMPYYSDVFPRADIDLDRLVFYFTCEYPDRSNPLLAEVHKRLFDAIEIWRRCYSRDSLVEVRGPDFLEILDNRLTQLPSGELVRKETRVILEGIWAEVFLCCDHVCGENELYRHFRHAVEVQDLQRFVDQMVEQRFIYRSPARQLIALPLWPEARNIQTIETGRAEEPIRKLAVEELIQIATKQQVGVGGVESGVAEPV